MSDRRRDVRFPAPLLTNVTVTLRPGNTVHLVDIARGGALVHSRRPLRPGGRVQVVIATESRAVRLEALVVRCAVTAIEPTAGVTYAGALAFEGRCDLPWEQKTHDG